MRKEKKKRGEKFVKGLFLIAEAILIVIMIVFINPFDVIAGVGEDNVTVTTLLEVGNSAPIIVNVSINDGATSIDLSPNSTVNVTVESVIIDYNGDTTVPTIYTELFDNSVSNYGDSDDNNYHYTNRSCSLNTAYGDSTEFIATCTFEVFYYAHNSTWNATVYVNDSSNFDDWGEDLSVVNTLLALGLPNTIDYGLVNSTFVSAEQNANVTNFGNVRMNLTLEGYATSIGDGLAMNCTAGTINISVGHEKYNLTSSNPGILTLGQTEDYHDNLSSTITPKAFNLGARFNDTDYHVGERNETYWRIYVPVGAAGSCSGNIVFGAAITSGV